MSALPYGCSLCNDGIIESNPIKHCNCSRGMERMTRDSQGHEFLREQQQKMQKQNSELNTTIEDWKEELSYLEAKDRGFTTRELSSELGISRSTVIKRINSMIDNKICIQGQGIRYDSTGRLQRVPVYQLVKKSKEILAILNRKSGG